MDMWTFLWVFLSLAVLISILESIHRKSKRRRAEHAAQQLHEQLRNQPYQVYTIHPNGQATATDQQIFSPSNAHIIRLDDLPPKYEDIIIAHNSAFVSSTPNLPAANPSQAAATGMTSTSSPIAAANGTGANSQSPPTTTTR